MYPPPPRYANNAFVKLLCSVLLSIVLLFTVIGCSSQASSLTEKETAVFELVKEASLHFKVPSSVRIICGRVMYLSIKDHPDYDFSMEEVTRGYYISANVIISATNSYGTATTGYYMLTYNDEEGGVNVFDLEELGELTNTESAIEACYRIEKDVDYAAVNSELKKYWEELL